MKLAEQLKIIAFVFSVIIYHTPRKKQFGFPNPPMIFLSTVPTLLQDVGGLAQNLESPHPPGPPVRTEMNSFQKLS